MISPPLLHDTAPTKTMAAVVLLCTLGAKLEITGDDTSSPSTISFHQGAEHDEVLRMTGTFGGLNVSSRVFGADFVTDGGTSVDALGRRLESIPTGCGCDTQLTSLQNEVASLHIKMDAILTKLLLTPPSSPAPPFPPPPPPFPPSPPPPPLSVTFDTYTGDLSMDGSKIIYRTSSTNAWGGTTAWTGPVNGYVLSELPPTGSIARLTFTCRSDSPWGSSGNWGQRAIGFRGGTPASGDTWQTIKYGVMCMAATSNSYLNTYSVAPIKNSAVTDPGFHTIKYDEWDNFELKVHADGSIQWFFKDTLRTSEPAGTVQNHQLPWVIFIDAYNQGYHFQNIEFVPSV